MRAARSSFSVSLRGEGVQGVMCQCLSFLAYPYPSISERWALWKFELQRLIARIASYNGPFTGLEVPCISIRGTLTTYSSSGRKVQAILAMGTCMSSSSSSFSVTAKQAPLKQKQTQKFQDPASLAPVLDTPSKRIKGKPRKDLRDNVQPQPEVVAMKKICTNGSSNFACLFSQQGRKGINQDAMIVWEDFGSQEDAVFCGVFDGHGPHGHLVAQIVRNSLPSMLVSSFKALKNTPFEEAQTDAGDHEVKDSGLYASSSFQALWRELLVDAYIQMDKELQGRVANIDCYCSGTTAVTLVKQGNDVVLGNVGDSRAIIGTRSDDGSLIAVPLTVDLKPNLPQEAERIRQCRGRVFALQDEPEVHRVWLPHDNSPGLAMARAFGDFCLKNFGVIAIPEVTHRRLTDKDQFIVLATDGVWDVLSNKEVVDIVASVPSKSLAARAVVETAVHVWRSKFPSSKIDDCAVVCLFLKEKVAVPLSRNMKKPSLRKRTNPAGLQKIETSNRERKNEQLLSSNSITGDVSQSLKHSEGTVTTESEHSHEGRLEVETFQVLFQEYLGTDKGVTTPGTNQGTIEAGNAVMPQGETEVDRWSALDGVTRVNSLVNLPRFTPGDSRAGA